MYQPITQILSLSEMCTYAEDSDEVPLVCIFANRHTMRPFLYFHHYDVLLTTLKPVTFSPHQETVDIHGMILIKLLFLLDAHRFNAEILGRATKSKWKAAKMAAKNGQDLYRNVKLTTEEPGVEDEEATDPNISNFEMTPIKDVLSRKRGNSSKQSSPKRKRT